MTAGTAARACPGGGLPDRRMPAVGRPRGVASGRPRNGKENVNGMRNLRTLFLLAIGISIAGVSAAPAADQAAPATGTEIQVSVTASCIGKVVEFRIANSGDRWPGLANIRILRVDDRAVITERKLRLTKEQKVSFRVSEKKNPGVSIGLFVEPSWRTRPFKYDAEIVCK